MIKSGIVSVVSVMGLCGSVAGQVVYVSSLNDDAVLRYDADSGVFIDTFVTSGSGGLDEPHGSLERCADVLVCSFATDQVLRYDRATGAFIDVFIDNTDGLDNPVSIQHGPDGNLYVSSQGSDEILRYTPDGVFIDVFVTNRAVLDGPSGFAFGPDGRWYVAGRFSGNVIAYDGTTGAFDALIADTTDGLGAGSTFGLMIGSNDDVYVVSDNAVWRYDLDTAAFVATIPLAFPIGMGPGPNGEIIVANSNNLFSIDPVTDVVSPALLSGGVISTLNFFRYEGAVGGPDCGAPVPTASAWGLIVLTVLLVVAGAVVCHRRVGHPA